MKPPTANRICHRLLVVWFIIPLACSQAETATNSAWSVQVWQTEDGLPNNNVNGLVQTADGYLWLATPSCLARFDGVRFEEFPPASFAEAYWNQRIRLLARGRRGGLCLGVDPGHVILLNDGTATIVTNHLPEQTLEALTEDDSEALWVSYHNGAICRIQNGVVTQLGSRESLPPGAFACTLATDSRGRVWFSKGTAVGLFRGGEFTTRLRLNTPGARIAAARDGGLWICSGFRLFKYHDGGVLEERGCVQEGVLRGNAMVLLEDHTGAVWIGTVANGLFRYDGSRFESIPTSDREILSLAEDREGNLWVGTGGGGLNRVRPRLVTLEGMESGAPFEALQSLAQDASGTIWATTQDGALVRWSDGVWDTVSTNAALASAMMTCVAVDSDGDVWIGTRDARLFCWRHGRIQAWGPREGLVGRTIHALWASPRQGLWIGEEAPDAVQCLRDGTLRTVPIPPDAHHLRTITEDRSGNIWLGGQRGVLLRIAGGQVTDESALTSDLQKPIRCLYAGDDGSLWMGFAAGGVARLKNGQSTRITREQGLYSDAINQILPGDRDSVWFGSDRGIFRVRQQELNDLADGRIATVRSIHYGRSEGVPRVQARFGDWPGALRSRNDDCGYRCARRWPLSTRQTCTKIRIPPSVLLNRVKVDDQTVALYGGGMPVGHVLDLGKPAAALCLSPRHRRLEFEFTALSFGPAGEHSFSLPAGRFRRQLARPGSVAERHLFAVGGRPLPVSRRGLQQRRRVERNRRRAGAFRARRFSGRRGGSGLACWPRSP